MLMLKAIRLSKMSIIRTLRIVYNNLDSIDNSEASYNSIQQDYPRCQFLKHRNLTINKLFIMVIVMIYFIIMKNGK